VLALAHLFLAGAFTFLYSRQVLRERLDRVLSTSQPSASTHTNCPKRLRSSHI